MQYIMNITINLVFYLSLPLVIRFVLLRRPIRKKWAAICILAPLFIVFSLLINIQRDQGQKQIAQEYGIPYKPSPHMFGSPLLYLAMALSYSILRKGQKKTLSAQKTPTNQEKPQNIELGVSPMISAKMESKKCPFCAEKIKIEAIKCRFCGEMLDPDEVEKEVASRQRTIMEEKEKVAQAGRLAEKQKREQEELEAKKSESFWCNGCGYVIGKNQIGDTILCPECGDLLEEG